MKLNEQSINYFAHYLPLKHNPHHSPNMYLGATVIQYLDVSTKSLIHDVYRHIITVCQVPQQVKDLVGHHAILIILSQAPDKLQQFFTLLLAGIGPACLQKRNNQVQMLRPCTKWHIVDMELCIRSVIRSDPNDKIKHIVDKNPIYSAID